MDRTTSLGQEVPQAAEVSPAHTLPQPASSQRDGGTGAKPALDSAIGPRVYPGTDKLVKPSLAPKSDPVLTQGDRVSLNFENVTVSALASALLGDLLKVSYTIDAGGDAVVSLRTRKPLPRKQVLDVLDTVLLPHDLAIVRDAAGVYHVTKRAATVGSRPLTSASRMKDMVGAGTVIVPLDYIGAGEMAKILGPLAPREAIVYVDTVRNLLVLQGSKIQLEGWLEMVDAFDVDYLSGMSLGVFPLEYASVGVVYETLQTMLAPDQASAGAAAFGGGASPSSGGAPGATRPGAPGPAAGSGGAGGPLAGLVRLFPVERLNALVVVTPRSQMLSQVETWIRRLDQPTDGLEAGLFVYPVQNGSAVRMAELLNGLFGGSSGGRAGVAGGTAPSQFGGGGVLGTGGNRFGSSGSASGRSGLTGLGGSLGGGMGGGIGGTALGTSNTSPVGGLGGGLTGYGGAVGGGLGGAGAGPQTTVSDLEGNVRVVADEARNALLIRAPRTEYRRIERALRELDKAPTQVLIEASIVEINLTGALEYGVEWALNNGLGGGRRGRAMLNMNSLDSNGNVVGIGPRTPGFSYSVVNNAGAITATINALAQKSQVKVLSNPSLLVLDNHNATIQVGDQQPISSGGSTVTNGVVISDGFTYKDTGVMLSVTPSVNSGGLITLAIQQNVTDVGEQDTVTKQRKFMTRQIQSKVAVRSGETIVLGGMIRENEASGRAGVPLLSDVPLLGALFSTTSNTKNRTELMVLLTPRALENDDQVRAASVEMRQRIRSLSLQDPLNPATPAGSEPR
ncbi:type II secretion system secretin GspD [Ottowia flava]|uniref:Type IV pilus biogenesis and competence protein PilQ n=1 Tax=Ottowia flava TaxID=2675430 RepID=A0ABW4KSI6_9BURK|nr:type II secretion system secretin GspD [Ottowia sp. GY511]